VNWRATPRENFLQEKRNSFERQVAKLSNKVKDFATEKDHDLQLKLAHLNKLNPLDILALGYAKIEQEGKSIAKLSEVDLQKEIEINFVDGKLVALSDKKK